MHVRLRAIATDVLVHAWRPAPTAWMGRPVLLVSLVDPLKKNERRPQAD